MICVITIFYQNEDYMMHRVIVLTQDKDFYLEVEEHLKDGFTIELHTFDHGLELVNYFLTNYSQLVILDIDIIKEEIINLIEIIRTIHQDAKILLLLSPENMPLCSSALSIGVSSYQLKPLSVKRVLELITTLLQIQATPD